MHTQARSLWRTLHFLLYTPRAFADVLSSVQAAHNRTKNISRRCGLCGLKSSSNSIERVLQCCKRAKPLWLFPLAMLVLAIIFPAYTQKIHYVFNLPPATMAEFQIDTTLVDFVWGC